MTKSFFLRGSNKKKTIYLRLRDGEDVDYRIAIGVKIDETHWDKGKGWPKDHADNSDFEDLADHLNVILKNVRKYEVGPGKGKVVDRLWLEEAVTFNKDVDKRVLVREQLALYRDRLSNRSKNGRVGVSAGTLRNFNTTISRLKRFEESTGHNYSLQELSFRFHDDYLEFARDKLGLAVNSVGKDIKNIKSMANDAKDRDLKVHENVLSKRFHAPSEKTTFVILSPEELQIIFNYEGPDFLMNTKAWLLIGCWTGARVNDLLSFNETNLVDYKKTKIIRYTQSKTGKVVRLGIHPHVNAILSANNWMFPRPISDVKFNEYLKELCKRIGIDQQVTGVVFDKATKKRIRGEYPKWKVVSSHISRRSFASNHYGHLPTSRILAATGHSTEKQLLSYIGETLGDHVDDFLDLWSKNK